MSPYIVFLLRNRSLRSKTCRPMAITTLWENGLFAANVVQCLMAVPKFREAVSSPELQLHTFPPGKPSGVTLFPACFWNSGLT